MTSPSYNLTHLKQLEAESIHIMREVVAEFENPVMLYSVGKDSSVLAHLALKAFHPSPPPFQLLHVDTTWKFQDMYKFRERYTKDNKLDLKVHINQEGVKQGINPFDHGSKHHTDVMKTQALLQALTEGGYDAAFGGARRDEEKSRAKERVYSFRDANHQWDPKNQRPELWNVYNASREQGRVASACSPCPTGPSSTCGSTSTSRSIPDRPAVPRRPMRPVVKREGTLIMVDDERMRLEPGEKPDDEAWCASAPWAATRSPARSSPTRPPCPRSSRRCCSPRSRSARGRVIDYDESASMERKKREGYF